MNTMFAYAALFNGDLSKWDVSRVTDMSYMFYHASSFNGDLSKWDVSRVTNMVGMFYSASKFSQTLCGAWAPSAATKDQMFDGSLGKIGPSCASKTTLIGSPFPSLNSIPKCYPQP